MSTYRIAVFSMLLVGCAPTVEAPLPRPDHLEILGLLRGGEFAALDDLLVRYQRRFEQDVRTEIDVERAFKSFWIEDPTAEAHLDQWVAAIPDSDVARLARAKYLARRGWAARGGRFAQDTPRWRFQEMSRYFERSAADLQVALERNPRLTEGYVILQGIAQAVGQQEGCREITRRALGEVPASFRIYEGQLDCLQPRWGGSYEEMVPVITELQAKVDDHPRLAALVGYPDLDRARALRTRKEYAAAISLMDRALGHGPFYRFYVERADNHYRRGDYQRSLEDLQRALELQPDYPPLLGELVYTLNRLRQVPEVIATLERLRAIDPADGDLSEHEERTARMLVLVGHEALEGRRYERSIEVLDRAAAFDPGNHEAFYWRGRAHLLSDRHDEALADFLKAVEIEPRHYHSYVDIDWILARRGRWGEILGHWNAYLALEPSDARALLERAGTHRHAGRRDAALADLLRACRLDNEEACRLYERERAAG